MDTITLARRVVAECQCHLYRYRDGEMQAREYGAGKKNGWTALDLFSASAIVQVYDALNETNRAKYGALDPYKAATVAFKLTR